MSITTAPARPPARVTAALLTILLAPFPLILWSSHGLSKAYGYDYEAVLFPVDLGFTALVITATPHVIGHMRARGRSALRLFGLAIIALGLAFLAHPSLRGAHLLLELAGALGLASVFAEEFGSATGRLLAGAVGAIAVLETAWSATQAITGQGLGLHQLGETADPFFPITGGVNAPMGSTVHPYVLAGLALVAAALLIAQAAVEPRPWPWLVAAGVAMAPVGFTYSRAALLGSVGALVCLAVGAARLRDRGAATRALVALGLGLAIPIGIANHGWRARADTTIAAGSAKSLTTDRAHLDHEAFDLISRHPVAGVGPAEYIGGLKQRYGTEPETDSVFKPVHNVVLLTTAEGGLVVGALFAAFLLALVWRAWKGGPIGLAVAATFFPYWMLDHLPYTFPQGVLTTGLWLGAIEGWAAGRGPAEAGVSDGEDQRAPA